MAIQSKIRFSPQKKGDFIIELREKVKLYFETNKLSKNGNPGLIFKSIFMFLLYMAPYFLMLSGVISSFYGILLCWFIMGVGMAGMGMALMHDANHGSFSEKAGINAFFSKSLYLLGGFPPTWRYQHNTMHHGFTNIDGQDEDIDPPSFLRFSPHKPLHNIHRFQYLYAWFFYGLMTISWATEKDFKQLYGYKKSGVILSGDKSYRSLFIKLIVSKIIYFVIFLVVPLLVLDISWYWVLLFFLMMHFVCSVILGAVFQTAHVIPSSSFPLPDENGNVENNWAVHQMLTTADYSPRSRFFSWFIGGLNFQVEHHLFPNISHVHYKNISPIVRETAKKYNLPYHVQANFYQAVLNHIRMLKTLGRF